MGAGLVDDDGMLQHFAGGQHAGIGRFTADPATGSWWWDDVVFTIFGYPVGEVQPCWELIRRHIPGPDLAAVEQQYADAGRGVGPFGWSHRICAANGVLRSVLVVGDSSHPDGDPGLALTGFVIDLTDLRRSAARAAGTDAIRRSAQHRAVIEQAKGVLMLAYDLNADAAFGLLSRHSQNTNRKLYTVASTVMASISADRMPTTSLRGTLDRILTGQADRSQPRQECKQG